MYGGLRGRRILITRARSQGEKLHDAIRAMGAEPLWVPAIETVPEPLEPAGRALLHDLGRFAWVAFASENAVRFFLERLEQEDVSLPRSARIASVGAATTRALQAAGLPVSAQPEAFSGAALAALLRSQFRPARILVPRGESGREELAEELRAGGWEVTPLVCYRTRPVPLTPESVWLIEQGVDAAVFASPSAVKALWEALPETCREVLRKAYCLPIGPTTAGALTSVGLEPGPPPEEATSEGLVQALVRHFSGGA